LEDKDKKDKLTRLDSNSGSPPCEGWECAIMYW